MEKDQQMSAIIDDSDEITADVYLDEQHYTGWWADADRAGQGIAITDGETFQGEFQKMAEFPNGGKDWKAPSKKDLLSY